MAHPMQPKDPELEQKIAEGINKLLNGYAFIDSRGITGNSVSVTYTTVRNKHAIVASDLQLPYTSVVMDIIEGKEPEADKRCYEIMMDHAYKTLNPKRYPDGSYNFEVKEKDEKKQFLINILDATTVKKLTGKK